MFNSCTCARQSERGRVCERERGNFRQILLDAFQWNVQVNINTKPMHTTISTLAGYFGCVYETLDALTPPVSLHPLFIYGSSFSLSQLRLHSDILGNAFDIYCTAVWLHSIIQRIHSVRCPCIIIALNSVHKPQTQHSHTRKPFDVEWMAK